MGAKNAKGNDNIIIQNASGESRLKTGIIYNASDYVLQYYVSRAYVKEQSIKPATEHSQRPSEIHQILQQEYSEQWDDWKDWQKSQAPRSKQSSARSVKKSSQASQQQQQSQTDSNQPQIRYNYILVSVPRGKMQFKGLNGLLMGQSKLSICLRKPDEYKYLKDQETINHFTDICLVVNNDECVPMKKEQINELIGQALPDVSPIKKFDDDEATRSVRSGKTERSNPRSQKAIH